MKFSYIKRRLGIQKLMLSLKMRVFGLRRHNYVSYTSKSNISAHIKHIFEEGELEEDLVVRKFLTTASDGKNYTQENKEPIC